MGIDVGMDREGVDCDIEGVGSDAVTDARPGAVTKVGIGGEIDAGTCAGTGSGMDAGTGIDTGSVGIGVTVLEVGVGKGG